jgi:hypothetical protein
MKILSPVQMHSALAGATLAMSCGSYFDEVLLAAVWLPAGLQARLFLALTWHCNNSCWYWLVMR